MTLTRQADYARAAYVAGQGAGDRLTSLRVDVAPAARRCFAHLGQFLTTIRNNELTLGLGLAPQNMAGHGHGGLGCSMRWRGSF